MTSNFAPTSLFLLIALLGAARSLPAAAQGTQPSATPAAPSAAPCTAPECSQFDFWLGDWKLTWQGGSGTNKVTCDLDGCVIHEHFDTDPGQPQPLRGESVSMWNPQLKKWQQTWVDNQGSYLDFTGGWAGGKMTLSRKTVRAGKPWHSRMIFYNITRDSLDWSWEGSADLGKTWKPSWQIHYVRQGR